VVNRLGIVAALAACSIAGAARAEEGTSIKAALSAIGLTEPERPPINYRERAPLVLPPAKGGAAVALPPPQASLRETDPQWPKDPEAVKRSREAEEAKKPITRGYSGRMSDNNATLSIWEMRQGRRPDAGVPTENEYKPGDNQRESTWLNPLQLFAGKKDEDSQPSDVEPARDLLTDPPSGYRKPPGGKLAKTRAANVGVINPDRQESDPGAYIRSRGQQ
jgi:hypothetical protein